MGDQFSPVNEAEVRHMLKRTGFGAAAKDVKRAKKVIGTSRGEAAAHILGLNRKLIKLKGDNVEEIHNRWVKHLTKGKTPFLDKTVLFFHDHFSVTASVLEDYPEAIIQHAELHYTQALGNFKDYCKAINKNAAMMVFLNTIQNNKAIPNENYARELCELFTLGVTDLNGVENYTQEDIVQIARAFTGWRVEGDEGTAFLDTDEHDYMIDFPSRGPKVLFDNAHGFPIGGEPFTAGGEGENEIDEVIDILFDHLDSDGENTVARRTAFRLIEFFCYANPDKTIVDEVVAASGFATNWNIEQLIREIMVHDVFFETMANVPYDANTKKSVKWPIDYMIGTMRMLKIKPKGKDLELRGGTNNELIDHGENMGQVIGEPPSVFGWDWEDAWISSSTLLARYTFARDIINVKGGSKFKAKRFVDRKLTDPGLIADAIIDALGMTGYFTVNERTELIDYLTDGGINPVLDLNDEDVMNTKVNGAFGLVMQSAAFQLH